MSTKTHAAKTVPSSYTLPLQTVPDPLFVSSAMNYAPDDSQKCGDALHQLSVTQKKIIHQVLPALNNTSLITDLYSTCIQSVSSS